MHELWHISFNIAVVTRVSSEGISLIGLTQIKLGSLWNFIYKPQSTVVSSKIKDERVVVICNECPLFCIIFSIHFNVVYSAKLSIPFHLGWNLKEFVWVKGAIGKVQKDKEHWVK